MGSNRTSAYRFGLLGHEIQSSLSPVLHQAAGQSCGLGISYDLIDVSLDQLPDVLADLKRCRWHGINITAPYKYWAYRHVSHYDEYAAKLKSVNTIIVSDDGRLKGANTDWFGISESFADLDKHDVVLLGSGRMAESCLSWLLDNRKGTVTVVNRRPSRFAELKRRQPERIKSLNFFEFGESLSQHTTIINCLPKSCYDMLGRFSWENAPRDLNIYDLNYGQQTTDFLQKIDGPDRRVHDGVNALIGQGIESFRHWTGLQPNRDRIVYAVKNAAIYAR